MDAPALDSGLSSVTVYRSGARVVRTATLPAGASRVRVVRLPLTLDDDSVRAKVTGSTASATDVRVMLEVPPLDASLAPPRDEELLAAERAVALAKVETERLTQSITKLESLLIWSRFKPEDGGFPSVSPTDARFALVSLREARHAALTDELTGPNLLLRDASAALAALKERASRASTVRNASEHELSKTVVVSLDAAGPGAILELEYLVPGATWAPSYSLQLSADATEAALEVRAVVAQRTGEDWAHAKLVLSTASPAQWTELPELSSVRIGRAQPPRAVRGFRPAPEGAEALYADRDRAFGAPQSVAEPSPFADEVTRGGPVPHDLLVGAAGPPPGAMAPPAMAPPPPAFGGAPPPAPVAAAAPARARAAVPAAPMQAQPQAKGAATRSAPEGAAPPASRPTSARAQEPQASLELEADALAYASLRMRAPHVSGRGALVAVSTASIWLESLEAGGVHVQLDVLALVRARVQLSRNLSLPPRHTAANTQYGYDYAYPCRDAVTIPSDGQPHNIPVTTRAAPAALSYVVVPREAEDAFRFLELQNPLDAGLLPGPVDVYLGGRYLLTADLPSTSPRSKLSLGLGVEQAIKVARNTRFAERATGLMSGGLALDHEVKVSLRNLLALPASIEVRERIPHVPEGHEDLDIDVAAEPAFSDWRADYVLKGGKSWRVVVPPGGAQDLVVRYTLKLAAKNEVVGGNRREGT